MNFDKKEVSNSVQLSALLEVSAPKPGNVNRYNDMSNLSFEQFLGASVSIGPVAEKSFELGKNGNIESNLGILFEEAVMETNKWQRGRNPNFGIITLTIPICAALGQIKANKNSKILDKDLNSIGNKVTSILSKSNTKDTINYYKAIKKANPKGLKKTDKYDVHSDKGKKEIKKDNINLLKLFQLSKNREIVMEDLSNNLNIILNEAYPQLRKTYFKTKNLPGSITETFLQILSNHKDTLIARKTTKEKSEEISQNAEDLINSGGYFNNKKGYKKLDKKLRKTQNLNPGSTADLTYGSILFLLLRDEVRP